MPALLVALLAAGCAGDAAPAGGGAEAAITSIAPAWGRPAGGTRVALGGRGLGEVAEVRFGGVPALLLDVSDDRILVVAPHHEPGPAPVRAVLADGAVLEAPEPFGYNLGAGSARFVDATGGALPAEARTFQDAAVGDVDGDGDEDAFLPGYFGDAGMLLLGDGTGGFAEADAACAPAASGATVHAELGDLDGDGDLDLVLVEEYARDRVLLDDGAGCFEEVTAEAMPELEGAGEGGDLADVDGDGDLDVAVAQGGATGQNRLFLNDGAAGFTEATDERMPAVALGSADVAAADLDGDGDADLAFASFWGSDELYRNEGGAFEATELLPEGDGSHVAVVPLDADSDGDLDLFVAGWGVQDRLYLQP